MYNSHSSFTYIYIYLARFLPFLNVDRNSLCTDICVYSLLISNGSHKSSDIFVILRIGSS